MEKIWTNRTVVHTASKSVAKNVLPQATKGEVQKSHYLSCRVHGSSHRVVLYQGEYKAAYKAPKQMWCPRHKVHDKEDREWARQTKKCLRHSKSKLYRGSWHTGQREGKSAEKAKLPKLKPWWVFKLSASLITLRTKTKGNLILNFDGSWSKVFLEAKSKVKAIALPLCYLNKIAAGLISGSHVWQGSRFRGSLQLVCVPAGVIYVMIRVYVGSWSECRCDVFHTATM